MDESMLSDILNLPLFADQSADAEQNVDPTVSGEMPEEPVWTQQLMQSRMLM